MKLLDIAQEIYYSELQEDSTTSIPMINFWLESNIGTLNNALGTCFTITDGVVDAELEIDEGSILKSMFLSKFYENKIRTNLGAAGVSVTEVREGDTVIRMPSKTEVARYFTELKKEEDKKLTDLIWGYKYNRARPQGIDYFTP